MQAQKEKKRLIAIIASALVVLAVVTFMAVIAAGRTEAKTKDGKVVKHPYSVLVNGREVMLVSSKQSGVDALSSVVKSYLPEGTEIETVTFDKKISFREREFELFEKAKTVLTTEQAADRMIKWNESDRPLFKATIVSNKYIENVIKPGVKFKYDDLMDIFEYKIKKKGKKGKKQITYEIKTENGEELSEKKKGTEITQEAVDAVVVTGNDDAPKDLKWEEYKSYQKEVDKEYKNAVAGTKMVNYGKKFLGNPYKWGGTSLTNGIDCVQFVRAIYRKYGIELPNKRGAFASIGKGVDLKHAQPGDIVYYGNHIAMYAGDGKVIHAQRKGINIRNINYRKWKTIRRVKKK